MKTKYQKENLIEIINKSKNLTDVLRFLNMTILGNNRNTINRRKINRPSYEQLLNEIIELGYSGTGRKYGVSDNTIRRWIKFYEKMLSSTDSNCN